MIRIACAAAFCMALVLSALETTSAADRSHSADAQIAQARDLFLADRLMEALDALDEQTLAQSGEANLLAGLIHLYRLPIDGAAAKLHFERAGALGVGHAFAILGHITIEEGCPDCPARAAVYYKRALEWGDSAEARFGLALALAEQDRMAEALAGFEALLSEETPQYWRLWAASFAGTMLLESDPYRGEAILLTSAAAGFPDAQAALGFFLLHKRRDAEAKLWLTRAVANRSEIGMEWYQTLDPDRAGEVKLDSVRYLLERVRTEKETEFARAADWCARSGRMDLTCLPHAFAHHQECMLGEASRELLEVREFDHSAVYRACRSRELYGRPLPEKPGAWPRLAE